MKVLEEELLETGPSNESEVKTGLSTFEAALAYLSTIIGGGIVGLPFSMIHTGIPAGLILNLFMMTSVWYGSVLYFSTIQLVPIPVESLYEIGFVVLGRRSIFLISIILVLGSYGLIMIYFIVFGDTFSSIVRNICYPDQALDQNNIFTSRLFYVVTLGVALTPVILRKEMKELKCVSITLFLSIGLFMFIFMLQLLQG